MAAKAHSTRAGNARGLHSAESPTTGEANAMTVKDPVCGMQIEKEDAVARVEYNGKAYYFCSEDCSSEFEDNPEDYADEGGVVE